MRTRRGLLCAALISAGLLSGCTGGADEDVGGNKDGASAGNAVAPGATGATGGQDGLVGCPQSPASGLFDHALCLCEDFNDVGSGLVVSSLAGAHASVGVNGRSNVVGSPRVDGTWVAYEGISGVGEISVAQDLVTTKSVEGVGRLSVGRDLVVGGDLFNVGVLDVSGALRLAGTEFGVGSRNVGSTAAYTAPAGPPCGCDPGTFFDVVAAVEKAKVQNDNASAGVSSAGTSTVGSQTLTLTTGTYYFGPTSAVGTRQITVKGAVAMHVDGDLDIVGDENITIEPGGVLDLYVSGDIRRVGHSALGTASPGGQLRLYIGGTSPVMLMVGDHALRGAIYAPRAAVAFVGSLAVEGALFARTLDGVGDLEIRYETQTVPPLCTGSPGEGEGSDAGTGTGTGGGSDGGSGGAADGGVIN